MNLAQSRIHAMLCMAVVLVACDSGMESTGIDGTGTAKGRDIISVGLVRSVGSIEVNGVRFDTAGAAVMIDGSAGGPADLNLGDVVLVEGTLNSGDSSAVAQRVVADHVLQGNVVAVDVARSSLVALGQTIQVSASTAYGASIAGGFGALSAGDRINVSGFRDLHGAIQATRIDRHVGGGAPKTIGAVTDIASDGRHISINDLVVDVDSAQWTPVGARTALARGDVVEVKGTLQTSGGPLLATSVQVRGDRLPGAADRVAHVEGYLTALDPVDVRRMEVNGLSVSSTDTTTFNGTVTVDAPLAVKGTVVSNGGVVATSVTAQHLPQVVPGSVSGRVFDAISGPVATPLVDIFVEAGSVAYSYWHAQGGPLAAGQDGRFTAGAPPNSTLKVFAIKPGYVQPCAVFVVSSNALNIEVELVAEATLDTFNPPPPVSATGAFTVTGNVYETTPGGRLPVAGARLWIGDSMGITYATTLTDRSGNYIICNMPTDPRWTGRWQTELWVQKDGWLDSFSDQIDATRSHVIDIEMKRK